MFLYTRWLAEQRGLTFNGPPRHPFNPLPLLRLTIAAGSTLGAIKTVYSRVWGDGADAEATSTLEELAEALGVSDAEQAIATPAVKESLRANTEEAISLGVFGVPTFAYGGELFWGDDATPLFAAFLKDHQIFKREPYVRFERVKPSADRLRSK